MAITIEELLIKLTVDDQATGAIAAVKRAMDSVADSGTAASDATDILSAANAGAAAAAKKLADAAASVTVAVSSSDASITRAGASADKLLRTYDPLERMNGAVATATNRFSTEQAKANTALAAGAYTQDQYTSVVSGAAERQRAAVSKATDAYNASQLASGQATVALGHNADAADRASGAHAGFYREVLVLGHEMVTGNYNRIPGSLMVLAERTGDLEGLAKSAFAALISVPGLMATAAVVGVGGLTALAVHTEDAFLATQRLSDQLRATRTDYALMTQAVVSTAGAFASTFHLPGADVRSAAQTIAGAPTFSGSPADLQNLLTLSNDIAQVWNLSLPDAAKKLAEAMADPLAAAKALAKEGYPEMTAAEEELVIHLVQSGQVLEAQRVVLEDYAKGVRGAADQLGFFGRVWRDLNTSMGSSAPINTFAPGYRSPTQIAQAAIAAGQAQAAQLPVGGGFPHTPTPYDEFAAQNRIRAQAQAITGGPGSVSFLQDQIALLEKDQSALDADSDAWRRDQEWIDKDRKSLEKHGEVVDKHNDSLNQQVELIMNSILGNNRLADAYLHGAGSVLAVTAAEKARQEAIKLFPKDLGAQADATERLTGLYLDQAQAEADVKAAQDAFNFKEQLDYIDKETSLLGASNGMRDHELAVLKERQKLLHDNANLDSAASQAALLYAGQVADATSALQHQQQVINDLTGMATQAFDQVGNAIAQAFTSGAGHAVNFANVLRASLSSVMQEIAKLALINPVLNSLLGGSRSTLGDAAGLLGIGGGSGGLGGLSSLSGLFNSGGGSIGQSLGLTGAGGLLSTTLWGAANPATVGATALYGGAGAFGGAGGVSLGSLLGGAGAGFGAGMLLNSLLGGHQTGGMIGSAGGALAGAAIGSIIPGIGTLIGGLLGGAAGGGLGGLFGQGSTTHGWDVSTSVVNGQLTTGDSHFKQFDGSQILAGINATNSAINALVSSRGLTMTQDAAFIYRGADNNPTNSGADLKYLQGLHFGAANDNMLNGALSGRSFNDAAILQNFVTFYQDTYEGLTKVATATSAYDTQLQAINDSYAAATTAAQGFGLATDGIAASQAAAIQALKDAQLGPVNSTVASLVGFADSLSTGSASPLSPLDILSAARGTFNTDTSAALGGDLAALGRVQGDANTFLSASRNVNGSGAGYVADFGAVLSMLQSVTTLTPDTLTASVVRQTTQTQTDQLLAAFASLNQQIVLLRQQVGITNSMPARLAA